MPEILLPTKGQVDEILASLGKTTDAQNANGTAHAKLRNIANTVNTVNTNVGSNSDAANAAGSVHAKLKDLKLVSLGGFVMYNTAGSRTWRAPEGVTKVWLTMFGGGGGGAGGDNRRGGGGGGGAYLIRYPVTVVPNTNYTLVVGAGGAGGAGGYEAKDGGAGGASTAFGLTCNGGESGKRGSAISGISKGGIGTGVISSGANGGINAQHGEPGVCEGVGMGYDSAIGRGGVIGRGERGGSGGGGGYGSGGNGGDSTPISAGQQGGNGAGGGGGAGAQTSTNATAGGAGGAGIIIIEW